MCQMSVHIMFIRAHGLVKLAACFLLCTCLTGADDDMQCTLHHGNKQTNEQTNKQANKQANKQTNKQTNDREMAGR